MRELLFGVPYYRVVNAAFTHAHPLGSRFNGPERGAWYAAFEIKTAQVEVAFHKTVQLAEIDRFEDDVTFDDYLADLVASFTVSAVQTIGSTTLILIHRSVTSRDRSSASLKVRM